MHFEKENSRFFCPGLASHVFPLIVGLCKIKNVFLIYLFFAFSGPVQVGIDVMRLQDKVSRKNVQDFFRLMTRKFTSEEWNYIRGHGGQQQQLRQLSPLSDQEQLARFYRLWCLKESFVKAEGSGLQWDLERLCFQVCILICTSFAPCPGS